MIALLFRLKKINKLKMKYSKLYSLRAPDVGYLTLNLIENSSGLSNVLLKSGTTVILIKTVTR